MNIFKTRGGAAAVLVLAVVGSSVYGCHRSLARESDKVTALNGTIAESMQTRADLGREMHTLVSQYLPETDPAMEKLEKALTALETDIFDRDGERDIRYSLDGIYSEALKKGTLTEEDRVRLMELETKRTEAEAAIDSDPYNAQAMEFNNEKLGAFPAKLLGKLTGIRELPVYH